MEAWENKNKEKGDRKRKKLPNNILIFGIFQSLDHLKLINPQTGIPFKLQNL